MNPCIRGKVSNWSFATVVGEALPPRDPDDDETEDEEDDEQDEDLEGAGKQERLLAGTRRPGPAGRSALR